MKIIDDIIEKILILIPFAVLGAILGFALYFQIPITPYPASL